MEFIDSYSRREALNDGFQVRIPDDIRDDAGIKFPVYVTRTVWDKYLRVPVEMRHQDLEGRIWDMLTMFKLKAMSNDSSRMQFKVVFQLPDRDWEDNEKPVGDNRTVREVILISVVGASDIDDARPAITIMKPGED